ncbi:Thiol-disulfide oxidoreductase ResA [Planctomycetes bacterium CA13]|uniref:Thiol-disulfide oxidoreductase ResA n=1 Tax=Novipirellula herctigrandis TaxID=2527986 RepID=A0A5C5Z0I3_9BACT|nr:Thiol-disulfide oxidoreductase ResA [Planctomycetes bacterium CA13]
MRGLYYCFLVGMLCLDAVHLSRCDSAQPTAPVSQEDMSQQNSPLGQTVTDFTLTNAYGKSVSLSDFENHAMVAVVFLGTECPLAKLYGPRLNELQATFAGQGLMILGINSNKQDSLTELAAYGHRHQISFPLLKDKGNRIADVMKAERTPEVFLLDRNRVVRYHGRIDDQYGVGYSRDKKINSDLEIAIEELASGKPISNPSTEAVGCHIGRVKQVETTGQVTFNKDIAPIFNARCVTCHREGEIAPFTLTCYDDVLGWEDTILEVIDNNRMPPWSADPAHGEFANDARLGETEKQQIADWVDGGMPEGEPGDLPDPPVFTAGWRITPPDQVIAMREMPFEVPAEGIVDYQRFVVDPQWDEDKYIVAAEARPENRSVVHHILVYVIPPGGRRPDLRQVLVGYAPGSLPVELHDGVAIHVQAGSKLLFEMHYTPNGTAQSDLSYAGFCFTEKGNVRKHLQGRIAINPKFEIPAGASNHEVFAHYRAKQDELLISMTPHMHLRGKAFQYEARFPSGATEVLLNVPAYDFNWQLKYILREPRKLPRGTLIECRAIFDNSKYNLHNPDPTRSVRWGDQSWDEMMIGFMDTIPTE